MTLPICENFGAIAKGLRELQKDPSYAPPIPTLGQDPGAVNVTVPVIISGPAAKYFILPQTNPPQTIEITPSEVHASPNWAFTMGKLYLAEFGVTSTFNNVPCHFYYIKDDKNHGFNAHIGYDGGTVKTDLLGDKGHWLVTQAMGVQLPTTVTTPPSGMITPLAPPLGILDSNGKPRTSIVVQSRISFANRTIGKNYVAVFDCVDSDGDFSYKYVNDKGMTRALCIKKDSVPYRLDLWELVG